MPREYFIDLPVQKRAHDTDVSTWQSLIEAACTAPKREADAITIFIAKLANELGLADQFLEAGGGTLLGIDFIFEIPVRRHFTRRLEAAFQDQQPQC